jgi:hypothetical protein
MLLEGYPHTVDVKNHSTMVIVIALCQIVGAVNALIVVWVAGSIMSPSTAAKAGPYLLSFAIVLTYGGLRETWYAYRKRNWAFMVKGIGLLLGAVVIWDIWNTHDRILTRDIVLLVLAAIAPIPLLRKIGAGTG